MASSLTITFSGTSSVLQADFLPEIMLDEKYEYSCALLDLIIKNDSELQKIMGLGVICIGCDIICNSYINGVPNQTIHQFVTTPFAKGQTIFVENPKHLNYFPIKTKRLRSIQISIFDKKGKPVNTSSTDFICRINIKKVNKSSM